MTQASGERNGVGTQRNGVDSQTADNEPVYRQASAGGGGFFAVDHVASSRRHRKLVERRGGGRIFITL